MKLSPITKAEQDLLSKLEAVVTGELAHSHGIIPGLFAVHHKATNKRVVLVVGIKLNDSISSHIDSLYPLAILLNTKDASLIDEFELDESFLKTLSKSSGVMLSDKKQEEDPSSESSLNE